ncbi:MAG: EscU/YscU/HrcU family type III secretion system export apparatus switch protein [Actinomycetia bacterium]|nr:EscU/YscU/HrcU family type III secretion system export apparatus switch protein [Actinomycetes bacterium]
MSKRDGKTEKPTQRRRKEARREGNLPRSQETNSMIAIAAALVTLGIMAPKALAVSGRIMRQWFSTADPMVGLRKEPLIKSVLELGAAWCPPALAAAIAGTVVSLGQGGIVLMPKTARPSFKNISWKKGLGQLSPRQAGYALLRNVLKFVAVGAALIAPVTKLWHQLPRSADLRAAAGLTGSAMKSVTSRVLFGALLIAVIDQIVTRRRWRNGMMMSRQQIIDESRMQEGDPHAKAQRKRRGMELRRRRSLGDVATADVVVTNPTHFAVALAYAERSAAPRVVCKGTDRMARRIRRDASRHGVPIIENRPLARALYRQVPLGGYVPERFFDDVVKVLVAAYWRRGRVPGHVASSPGKVASQGSLTGARA